MITVFKDFQDTKNPKYYDIDVVLKSIKDCSIQKQIDEVRSCEDEEKKKELKKKLPCILFSGEFSQRGDSKITKHSGFVVLDFDKIQDLESKKAEIIKYDFVYSCFVSPSGNGLKVVVRIPAEITKHRGYYRGLMKLFPDLDRTSINESRICYASCDKDIYINKNATVFSEYVKDVQIPIEKSYQVNNYSKAERALKIIRESVSGEYHSELLKASKLMGGYIAGGLIAESEGIRLLENEISQKDIKSFTDAQKTIRSGIDYGKVTPIEEDLPPIKVKKQEYVSKTQSVIKIDDNNFEFIAKDGDIDEYIKQWREGTFVKGSTTGIPSFDKFFRFKRGNFNVVNGFDNVGKSTALWYLCLLSSLYNGWKWIIYSNENRSGTVAKKLIEFYCGNPIDKISNEQLKEAREFIKEHFCFISNEFLFNYKDMLNIAEKLLKTKKYDGMLIDPYNSLKIELSNNSKLSTHEYHYEAASEMQVFTKKNDMCIYLNCHVITGAMRLQKGETKHRAPGKADTEGGGKFSNKADDFMTFHRDVQDPDNYTKMEIHVRKVKEVETGGGYTPYESPYILEMKKGMCGYIDEHNFDAIESYWESKRKYGKISKEIDYPADWDNI